MQHKEFHTSNCRWHIRSFGRGRHLLITFHGFGEDGGVFSIWEKLLQDTCTIVAVDLPFHGKSAGPTVGGFNSEDVVRLIQGIRAQFDHKSYSLLGHSLGARMVMAGRHRLSESPSSIWLLAPDGLATRRLGLVNAVPSRFREFAGRFVERWHRQWIKLAGGLHAVRLLDAFSLRYLRFHLADAFRRRRLMSTWCALSNFPVNRREWLQAAQAKAPAIVLIMGDRDPLINWDSLKEWLREWPVRYKHIRNAGHDLIDEPTAILIRQSLSG